MQRCPYVHLREAYFAIDPQYYVARSDLFRPYLLHEYGGLWLDLRGCPSVDMEMIGLEQIFRKFHFPPPRLELNLDYELECLCGSRLGGISPARVLPLPSGSWKSNSLDWEGSISHFYFV